MGDAEGAERVDDGVHDAGKCPGIAGLAGPGVARQGSGLTTMLVE
jgi:hypothetical protein